MSVSDVNRFEINRKIRAVFVRHRIDLGVLSIQKTGTSVRIRGTLKRLPGVVEDLTPAIVDGIFIEIERIPNVGRVEVDFDNWKRIGISHIWQSVAKQTGTALFEADKFTSGTHAIDEESA